MLRFPVISKNIIQLPRYNSHDINIHMECLWSHHLNLNPVTVASLSHPLWYKYVHLIPITMCLFHVFSCALWNITIFNRSSSMITWEHSLLNNQGLHHWHPQDSAQWHGHCHGPPGDAWCYTKDERLCRERRCESGSLLLEMRGFVDCVWSVAELCFWLLFCFLYFGFWDVFLFFRIPLKYCLNWMVDGYFENQKSQQKIAPEERLEWSIFRQGRLD